MSSLKIHDVLIVGAGIAGLGAAYRLRGSDVVVLESNEHAGGRTESRQLGDYIYNAGAQVIMGDTSPVAQLADELNVSRTLIKKSRVPIFFLGKLYSARTQPGLLYQLPLSTIEKIRFALTNLSIRRRYGRLIGEVFDPTDPLVEQLNAVTANQFLRPRSDKLTSLWNTISTIADGEAIDCTTPYHPIMIMLHFLEQEYAVDGGTHQLTLAMARRLGDRIWTNHRVLSVEEKSRYVQVEVDSPSGRKTLYARRAILATPGLITRELVKHLPNSKLEGLAALEYASQTSAAVLLDVPTRNYLPNGVWRIPVSGHRSCAITDPSYFYPSEYRDSRGTGILRIYTGDLESRRLQSLSREDALERIVDDLDDMFPHIREHIIDSDICHWPMANARWRPGHAGLIPKLEASVGRLHFCGDYTGAGYLNGSLISGQRAAREVSAK
jgi:oxygen-dependent protoporphyrinogen oxidase